MIAYEGVTLRYEGSPVAAVADVSLVAARGEITAIVGPNGSGKSSLVRALIRRLPLAAGAIRIDGEDVSRMSRSVVAQRVATVTQGEDTTFVRRVADYVALGRHPHRAVWGADADSGVVLEAMERVGVAALLDRATNALSGGEWQRVRIARALAQGGDAIVLDEPTSFLDVAHEMEIFQLLDELAHDGRAILLVSHQLNLVARFAHHMILLSGGSVVAVGAPPDVMRGELLERVYRWPLVVAHDAAVGAPMLIPLRRGQSL